MGKKIFFVLVFLCSCILVFLSPGRPAFANPSAKTVGIGVGISNAIPTIEFALLMRPMPLELIYKHYLGRGLDLSLEIYAIQKKHIRWHVISPGLYLLMGTKPLSVSDVTNDRGLDITFGSGIDIMPWKNLIISISLRWFLPGMNSAYAAGRKSALEYAIEHFEFDPAKPLKEIIYENGEAIFEVASTRTKAIYRQAIKEPQIQFTLTWYFL